MIVIIANISVGYLFFRLKLKLETSYLKKKVKLLELQKSNIELRNVKRKIIWK